MQLSAEWKIGGIVVERRELTSKKNDTWRGYVVKVASLGATFELEAKKEQYDKLGEGQHLIFHGRFEERGGYQKLVMQNAMSAEDTGSKKGAA